MPTVHAFGAGASREYEGPAGPIPLDVDFLRALRPIWPNDPPHHYDGSRWTWGALARGIRQATGSEPADLGLEDAFAAVWRHADTRDRLCRGIELLLFWRLRQEVTPVHTEYISKMVEPGDTLITFNYDPLLEIALLAQARGNTLNWHSDDGYPAFLTSPVARHSQSVSGEVVATESTGGGASRPVEDRRVVTTQPEAVWQSRSRGS